MKKATEKKESGLELTKISIYPVKSKTAGNLKASVDLTFNNLLVCKGFKVIEGSSGLFVAKPTSKGSDDKYYDQVYVLSKSEWDEIADIILEEYEKGVK